MLNETIDSQRVRPIRLPCQNGETFLFDVEGEVFAHHGQTDQTNLCTHRVPTLQAADGYRFMSS